MKKHYFLLGWLLIFLSTQRLVAQQQPDTLIIGTKAGQLVLISDSLQKFGTVQANEIIKKALLSVKDSLTAEERRAKRRADWEAQYTQLIKNKSPFRPMAFFGLGLVRNQPSPFIGAALDFAPQRQDYYYKKGGMYTFINLAVNTYFTFAEAFGEYDTRYNIFLEATLGNRMNNELGYTKFSEISAGLGYLLHRDGNYFSAHTVILFVNVGLPKTFVKIRPELYFTNQFTKVFPGIGIKLN
ncbi:MAG: hypothetical protein REI78_05945 [Pedobacter sp.]|nr:hypothetical protein [Pedobacter sp.]MDQ8052545.1 hypothetical protein [Pedobacter sp.]